MLTSGKPTAGVVDAAPAWWSTLSKLPTVFPSTTTVYCTKSAGNGASSSAAAMALWERPATTNINNNNNKNEVTIVAIHNTCDLGPWDLGKDVGDVSFVLRRSWCGEFRVIDAFHRIQN